MQWKKHIELIIPIEFQKTTHQSGESHFEIFFNFLYYFFFAPFKIETDSQSGDYALKRNRLQQVKPRLHWFNFNVHDYG